MLALVVPRKMITYFPVSENLERATRATFLYMHYCSHCRKELLSHPQKIFRTKSFEIVCGPIQLVLNNFNLTSLVVYMPSHLIYRTQAKRVDFNCSCTVSLSISSLSYIYALFVFVFCFCFCA